MTRIPDSSLRYEAIAVTDESTVVAALPPYPSTQVEYQSEAELEDEFLSLLEAQAYERVVVTSSNDLENNLRKQLELLNNVAFSDPEWKWFFASKVAARNEGVIEKTARIQEDHIQVLSRDDGTSRNIMLIDKSDIHNNRLQVLNQYEAQGEGGGVWRRHRYDVTILVNGLPLVHVELKRRGIALREAFNQIKRYQRESFWADAGLFEYVQVFVISNGTHTKYYANTTRARKVAESESERRSKRRTSNTFEFTSWWADAQNRRISDLRAFAKTFLAKHTIMNVLTKYCVFDVSRTLLVMRPYQIVASERILQKILISTNSMVLGTVDAGGYIWHATGSGKTLTSFKTAQLASRIAGVDKVIFVVDRKDLDYQTMLEYNRFERDSVNGSRSTNELRRQLEEPTTRIIITTIQKLARFVNQNKDHAVTYAHVVLMFDECHRSQFGSMGGSIRDTFKRSHLFGFTGTPIFGYGASSPHLNTTQGVFGERLHEYTIVNAIDDSNVLPFYVSYQNTVRIGDLDKVADAQVEAIDTEEVLLAPERVRQIVKYVLQHFDKKTNRRPEATREHERLRGFNSIFATQSIHALKLYYSEFTRQEKAIADVRPSYERLNIAAIFSYSANEDELDDGLLEDEALDTHSLDSSSRDFLEKAIEHYNSTFGTSYDTSAAKFENYYKDVARRLKNREIDLLLVVNMFLTGFDAPTLNTLWVDKNLRSHGLIQAFSRTNRILNSVKTHGNIVAFRNLEPAVTEALAIFGNSDAQDVVLLKPYAHYRAIYSGYVSQLHEMLTPGRDPFGEQAEKSFVDLFGKILRLRNVLVAFDEFADDDPLSPRDLQDYTSTYNSLAEKYQGRDGVEKDSVLDDVVFEVELVKQVEVNIDYILLLIAQLQSLQAGAREPRLEDVEKAVDASPSLRNRRDLIVDFIDSLSAEADVNYAWRAFVRDRREAELNALIVDEGLREEATRIFVADAFKDGGIQATGIGITGILPPVSRFNKESNLTEKKERVLGKLMTFFERYSGLT